MKLFETKIDNDMPKDCKQKKINVHLMININAKFLI